MKLQKEKNIYTLDAPVSGGDVGAKEAKLAIMVGGEKEIYDRCLPLLEKLGNKHSITRTSWEWTTYKKCAIKLRLLPI